MRPIRESLRIHARRLFFSERLSFDAIAQRLRVPTTTIRDAIVIDGGLRPSRSPGPFHHQEHDQ